MVKDMSRRVVLFNTMNLHEECLLKYLLNPLDLLQCTELLKINNTKIERALFVEKIKKPKVSGT